MPNFTAKGIVAQIRIERDKWQYSRYYRPLLMCSASSFAFVLVAQAVSVMASYSCLFSL